MRVSLSANDLCVSEGFVTIAKEEPIDVMGASPLSDVIEILPARLTSLSLAAGLVGIAPPRLHDTPVEPLEREVAAARRRELRAAGEAAASQAAADADQQAAAMRFAQEAGAGAAQEARRRMREMGLAATAQDWCLIALSWRTFEFASTELPAGRDVALAAIA